MKKRIVKSTVYPFGYDKKTASDRFDKQFTKAFNAWAEFIKDANMMDYNESVMNSTLTDAKILLGV